MPSPEFEQYEQKQAELAAKPLPAAFRSKKNGRVFRATAKLQKHADKFQLVPLDKLPEELMSQKDRNRAAALAKKASESEKSEEEQVKAVLDGSEDADADEDATTGDESEKPAHKPNTRPGRKPAAKS